MYEYRKLTEIERHDVVEQRKKRGFPWHRPPHPETDLNYRIVTATCFEHKKILDSEFRLRWFEQELLESLKNNEPISCAAWCVLPNHYHLLVRVGNFKGFSANLGKLHGRTSYKINKEDQNRGRKVWYRSQDRVMRSQAHFYTSLNYIHNNPVKHGYVKKWQNWPFSSIHWYFNCKGRDWLLDKWKKYPLRDYGAKWDQ